jgi:hypothetical protein
MYKTEDLFRIAQQAYSPSVLLAIWGSQARSGPINILCSLSWKLLQEPEEGLEQVSAPSIASLECEPYAKTLRCYRS